MMVYVKPEKSILHGKLRMLMMGFLKLLQIVIPTTNRNTQILRKKISIMRGLSRGIIDNISMHRIKNLFMI